MQSIDYMHAILFLLHCLLVKLSNAPCYTLFNTGYEGSASIPKEEGFAIRAEFFISVDGTLPNDVLRERIFVELKDLNATVQNVVEQALVLNAQVAAVNERNAKSLTDRSQSSLTNPKRFVAAQ